MTHKNFGIVLASDLNYLPYVWPLIRDLNSILPNCPSITLMYDGEVDETKKLQNLCLDLNIDLRIVDISEELSKGYLNTIRYITRATFARLFAPQYLKDDFERILYLDIDILIVRDFSFLLDLEMSQTLAAVPENFDSMYKSFGTYDFPYFNAGILLINTQKWHEEKILEQCLEVIQDRGPFNCQDQDALNLVFENRWQVLPPTSNVMVSSHDHSYDLPQLNFPAIVHFVGEHKPWKGVQWTRWHKTWSERNPDLCNGKSHFENYASSPFKSKRIYKLEANSRIILLKIVSFCFRSTIIRGAARKMKLKDIKVLRKLIGLDS